MGESNNTAKPTTVIWNCALEPKTNVTVGQKLLLSCHGFDELPKLQGVADATGSSESIDPGESKDSGESKDPSESIDQAKPLQNKTYEIVNDKGDPYFLHLLSIKKDDPLIKKFIVTPYRSYSSSLLFSFREKGLEKGLEKNIFQFSINDIKVDSVIKTKADSKMSLPQGPSLVLFTPLEFVFLGFVLLFFMVFVAIKSYKKRKQTKDYKNMMAMIKYEDLFMDLNIDLLEIEKNNNKLKNVKLYLEPALKKFFYKLFKKPIFFDEPGKMNHELKKLRVLDHDIRAIGVIKNDFNKVCDENHFNFEEKKDFIGSAKKNSESLKKV